METKEIKKIIVFFILVMICGVVMLFFGITGDFRSRMIAKKYETVDGYLYDYNLYSEGRPGIGHREKTYDTYSLDYIYTVHGQDYIVSTDYGVSTIPEMGSVKEIHYDPDHPETAIIVGPNKNSLLIVLGIFFTGGALVILLGALEQIHTVSNNIGEMAGGYFFTAAGCGVLYLLVGSLSIKDIFEYIVSEFSAGLFIVLMFIVVGLYLLISNLFLGNRKKSKSEDCT